jgi:hypothetical protein
VSDPRRPGDEPPDLPPEYADAYRRGYERAVKRANGEPVEDTGPIETHRPLFVDEIDEPPPVLPGGAHRAEPAPPPEPEPEPYDEPSERPAWLVPALLAALVVVLLLGAYGVGRVLSDNLAASSNTQSKPDGVVLDENGSAAPASPGASKKPTAKKYAGPTESADISGATASCESPKGVDSAGHKVRYAPGNVYDEDLTTAWRCDGDGSGEKLTLHLPDPTKVGEVGLVPGYAKTDARSGQDRYAENNRITKVRWVFDDGTSIEQSLDPSVKKRSVQSVRVPLTKTSQVVMEILDVKHGPRNTIAVSELRIGRAG